LGEFVATFDAVEVAADIVAAFVSHNSLPTGELPSLIESVHAAVRGFRGPDVAVIDPPSPAVSIRKSVTPDYLICLEDGKRFKSMRGHLALLGMTPGQYRAKWGLPSTYPMAAPNYAAKRSAMAKNHGFGQWRRKPIAAEPATGAEAKSKGVEAPLRAAEKRKLGRPRKVTS
jgi:predicted transcriptional regulator